MARHRTALQRAAGDLVSAVQKVWILQLGEADASSSERALGLAHQLFQAAASAGELRAALGARSIEEFLGDAWVLRHPSTHEAIEALKSVLISEC
ncbi:hypothetical protein [Aquimonas voraii]|uniref:hypothetical protein n=1 Tax=Aquimonas voraii TaxID=265719 RepID=UPI00115FE9EE|nr:hypothetical protein [Aquimonas voraii]